ncbi:MAG TPA: SRPBCC family protein [Solirubrobacteraceae bacterium]|nr:SRPBCC family protein [Solirubrobacteraceae bacterium]
MSLVEASIDLPARPERVWDTVMDPQRLGEWVTIHRALLSADSGPPVTGMQMRQRLHVRGVNVDIDWRLVQCRAPSLAVWEGRGPARSRAHTEYELSETADHQTHFAYRNEFHVPFGKLGAAVSAALVGGVAEHEAHHTLERLRDLLTETTN